VSAELSDSLPADLPPGRLLGAADGRPLFWMSDSPPDASLYRRLLAAHPRTGLWPVITEAQAWKVGELEPEPVTDIDAHDPAVVMQGVWTDPVTPFEGEEELFGDDEFEDFGPYGDKCPGPAAAGKLMADPVETAEWFAGELEYDADSRLLLAPVTRGADLPAVVGWSGPISHSNQVAPLLALLRGWEDRFGVRVVRLGFDTLDVSVAAPPTTPEHALHVAAEHLAFCPDNVEQGPGSLRTYAETIRGCNNWSFWWD